MSSGDPGGFTIPPAREHPEQKQAPNVASYEMGFVAPSASTGRNPATVHPSRTEVPGSSIIPADHHEDMAKKSKKDKEKKAKKDKKKKTEKHKKKDKKEKKASPVQLKSSTPGEESVDSSESSQESTGESSSE